MTILALDLSLTATGYASSLGTCGVFVPPKGEDRGLARLAWIRGEVLDEVEYPGVGHPRADLVVLEGLAFGAKGNAMLDLAGLAAVIRLALHDAGVPFVDVPPACLKLFATGKGNADKNAVLAEAIRKLGYAGSNHNESDALWLLSMAEMWYVGGVGADRSNEAQRRAMAKIAWPRVEVTVEAVDR